MAIHGKNVVGGRLSAQGSVRFRAFAPAAGCPIEPSFVEATQGEIDESLALAERAFSDARPRDPDQTAALLERIADEISAIGDELIDRSSEETGLSCARMKRERRQTIEQLHLFAGVVSQGSWVDARIDRAVRDRKPGPKPDLRRMLVPVGPVVVFPASNYPLTFSVAGSDTASALAAGCPVIVKARSSHPGTSELVAMAIQRAAAAVGLPDGWFSMLQGSRQSIGDYLVQHPAVKAVSFAGSFAGGRAILDAAAARKIPIPVYTGTGSVNPVFLLPGGLAERTDAIAAGLFNAITLAVGQLCTRLGLIVGIDDDGNLRAMTDSLAKLIEKTVPGTMLSSQTLQGYTEGLMRLSQTAGVTLAAQSRWKPDPEKTQAATALFATDADTFLAHEELWAEIFGPVMLVVGCRDRGQLLDVARRLPGQLTATVHATDEDLDAGGPLIALLEQKVGRLLFDGFSTGIEACPSMQHGGPYPVGNDPRFTSVGTAAVYRFVRPICYQDCPQSQLPPELRDKNQRHIWRLVDGVLTKDDVE